MGRRLDLLSSFRPPRAPVFTVIEGKIIQRCCLLDTDWRYLYHMSGKSESTGELNPFYAIVHGNGGRREGGGGEPYQWEVEDDERQSFKRIDGLVGNRGFDGVGCGV